MSDPFVVYNADVPGSAMADSEMEMNYSACLYVKALTRDTGHHYKPLCSHSDSD